MEFLGHWSGVLGILLILAVAVAMSNNRKAIDRKLVISGLCFQIFLAVFILMVPAGQALFGFLGRSIETLLNFSNEGAGFVFGPLVSQPETMVDLFGPGGDFLFAFKVIPTIIFVAVLVSMAYHLGWLQQVVKTVAWVVYRVLGVSGAEALSNAASVFVGQVEAQLLVKPYVGSMTQSELLTVMAGSMACIAGGVMAVYIQLGIPAAYLLTASLMAIPGAIVISKIVFPETESPKTCGEVTLAVEKSTVNLIDAAAHGCSDGLRIGLNVVAMLIGFIALIALLDFFVGQIGLGLSALGLTLDWMGLDVDNLSMKAVLGQLFSGVAVVLGTPVQDAASVGGLMGTKMVVNEFVAYLDLKPMMEEGTLDPKSVAIATFALCGFANFSSIAIQVGGIGEIAPTRKADLARLGLKALLCGTMASYMSAAIAGILISLGSSAMETEGVVSETSANPFPVIPLLVMAVTAGIIFWVNRTKWLGSATEFSDSQAVGSLG